MHSELSHALRQRIVLAGDGPPIACGPKVFCGEKAEATRIAPAAYRFGIPARTGGLRAVLHHLEPMALGNVHDAGHINRTAKQMNRDEHLGGGCDRRFNQLEVDQIGRRIHVHEDGCGSHGTNRFSGGKKTEGCGDHLIARTNAKASQGQHEGIGPAVTTHGMATAHAFGERVLEGFDLGSTDVLPTSQHLQDGIIELRPEVGELIFEAERRHLHGGHLKSTDQTMGVHGPGST